MGKQIETISYKGKKNPTTTWSSWGQTNPTTAQKTPAVDAEATKQKATERKGHLYLPHIYSLFLSWKLTGGFTQAEH